MPHHRTWAWLLQGGETTTKGSIVIIPRCDPETNGKWPSSMSCYSQINFRMIFFFFFAVCCHSAERMAVVACWNCHMRSCIAEEAPSWRAFKLWIHTKKRLFPALPSLSAKIRPVHVLFFLFYLSVSVFFKCMVLDLGWTSLRERKDSQVSLLTF